MCVGSSRTQSQRVRQLIARCSIQFQRAALCALVLFVGVPAHATTPNAIQLAAYERATEMERVKLLMALAKSPEADQVSYLLKLHPLDGPYAANRTLFLEGMVLKSKGKYTEAAKNFRAALAADPKLTLVRAELAETLVILQQDESALHHLRLLAAEAPEGPAANGVRSFIDQIDARTPFKFSGYVSLAPTTNVNSGARHATVYSPTIGLTFQNETAKSGFGVAGGLSASYNQRLGDDYMVVASGGADVRLYKDNGYNSYGISESLELRRLISNGYMSFGLVSSQQLDNQDYEPSYLSYGPRLATSLQVSQQDHLNLAALHEWRDPLTKGSDDSTALQFDASWTHAWNSTLNGTLFGGFDRVETGAAVSSYKTFSAGLAAYKEWTHGITTSVVGQIARTEYDGMNGLAAKIRRDEKISASISLTKRDLEFYGFAPSATYSYTDNYSNINKYDLRSHNVDFRLTREF
jgi:outer membrane protein